MALTAIGLKAAILAQLSVPIESPEEFAEQLATAIVTYLIASTQLVVVTACPAGAGTGTGTIT